MKKIFKNQKGIALIAVILITVVSIVAGGATFLGVRSLVTKEPFLQPFEDMGLMEIEDDEDKKESDKKDKESSKKEDSDDKEEIKNDDEKDEDKKVTGDGEESTLLIEEINDDGVE